MTEILTPDELAGYGWSPDPAEATQALKRVHSTVTWILDRGLRAAYGTRGTCDGCPNRGHCGLDEPGGLYPCEQAAEDLIRWAEGYARRLPKMVHAH